MAVWKAYSQSKLANVMFALELNQRLEQSGSTVRSLAAHPGLARTNLQPLSVASSGAWQEALAYRLMDPMFQSAAQGALPQLLAATSPSARGGEHYGPGQLGGMRGAPKRQPVARSSGKLVLLQHHRHSAMAELVNSVQRDLGPVSRGIG